MIAAGAAAKAVLATLGMLAVHGTLLALLAIVVVRAQRLRPAWQAAVWLVVLAKFALPVGPALPYSLSDLFALLTGARGGHAIVVGHTHGMTHVAPSLAPAVGWLVLAIAWAIGTLVVLGRGIARYRAAAHAAREAPRAPATAHELVGELAARLHVTRPRLVVGDAAVGPYVVGLVRPIVVVPPALLADANLLRAALLHELAHVKRRDAIGRMIQLAAVALFWWLPVVRIASKRLELARERACDAWALEAGDVSRPAYARLLLQMAQLRVAAAPALAAPHALDARVTAVLGPIVRPRLGLLHRFALLAWAALALGGARTAAAHGKAQVCIYTPQLAEALYEAYPEADLNQDGVLSRDEACEFQAEMKKRDPEETLTAGGQPLAEPLCCNCGESEGTFSPPMAATCSAEEGVSR